MAALIHPPTAAFHVTTGARRCGLRPKQTRTPGASPKRSKQFSFKSVGIQAQGRTMVLKINDRNTRQILQTASQIAGGLLTAENSEQGEDGIPPLLPVSCGREGPEPMVINLPTLHEEAAKVAELLSAALQEGHLWGDMAVLRRHHDGMEECARALTRRRLPHQVRHRSGDFGPLEDSIKVMTMHVSKGLEFPVVAMVGAHSRSTEDIGEERLLYVASTRATTRLVVACKHEPSGRAT
ncbi:3'-5' exonuclease [Variovorax guangxiensis]|uniref:DNA 3'-5' helicase II n=1 Tax=Variovorax guangxiensis TaxID=1775474 RepID=A0A502DXV0_9BURK|nr:hypothetical protein EAH83_10475 [Variovorax ginsengisoli]TPG29111.1 hypothetical protein EAH82_10135 [Variovorax guangxiensis]